MDIQNYQDYLEVYDDAKTANYIRENKDAIPKGIAQEVYIPQLILDDEALFFNTLADQREYFILRMYRRVYELFGKECPYGVGDFSVEEYDYGEDVVMAVLYYPTEDARAGNFLQGIVTLNKKTAAKAILAVVKEDEEKAYIVKLDLATGEWVRQAAAPEFQESLLRRVAAIATNPIGMKKKEQYRYTGKRCPVCHDLYSLGLTKEEYPRYETYKAEDLTPEEAFPMLNVFEREWFISGMCPLCQSRTFQKELPEDLERWIWY